MNSQRFSFVVPVVFATSTLAMAGPPPKEHFDIWLDESGGQIVTGSISEDGVPINPIHRVFGAELGADPAFPFSAAEPGLQTDAAGFGSLTELTFTILDPLTVWNGGGFDAASETMLIEFGPASVVSANSPVPGFNFSTDGSGFLHDHFDFTLLNGGLDPDPGIYLLSLSFEGVSPAYGESPALWLVFNLDQSEEEHDAAIEWVEQNLVPGPAGFSPLAMGCLLLPGRRRGRRAP